MEKIKIGSWGNSSAIRLSKTMMAALEVETGEKLNVVIENNKVILEKDKSSKDEFTIEELFEDYNGEKFQAKPFEFEPKGKEQW